MDNAQRTSIRVRLETEIERLIALLDAVDGDPDVETDEDFEPSLGGYGLAPAMTDCESDGLENGEFDWGEYDADLIIEGGGSHL
jgi:hypothetical protein